MYLQLQVINNVRQQRFFVVVCFFIYIFWPPHSNSFLRIPSNFPPLYHVLNILSSVFHREKNGIRARGPQNMFFYVVAFKKKVSLWVYRQLHSFKRYSTLPISNLSEKWKVPEMVIRPFIQAYTHSPTPLTRLQKVNIKHKSWAEIRSEDKGGKRLNRKCVC